MGERFGENGEVGRRRDSGSCARRELSDNGNQIIEIRPTTEEGSGKRPTSKEGSNKANCEKRQETNPNPAVKKAPNWNQGGLRDTVHDIITVGLTKKILRLKLKIQVTEVVTVSVSPPPSTVESPSPCADQQRPGFDSHLITIPINCCQFQI